VKKTRRETAIGDPDIGMKKPFQNQGQLGLAKRVGRGKKSRPKCLRSVKKVILKTMGLSRPEGRGTSSRGSVNGKGRKGQGNKRKEEKSFTQSAPKEKQLSREKNRAAIPRGEREGKQRA